MRCAIGSPWSSPASWSRAGWQGDAELRPPGPRRAAVRSVRRGGVAAATLDRITRILRNPAYAGAFVYGRTRSRPTPYCNGKRGSDPRPMAERKIVVKDKYPAYIDWESSSGSRRCCATTTRSMTGTRRAALPAMGPCCSRALLVRALRPQDGREVQEQKWLSLQPLESPPGRPGLPASSADRIDAAVVAVFFAAVTPAELEAWRRAHDARCQADEALDRAEAQQVERLRHQALLAERQFNKVDPDIRLVASESEHRWEVALRELVRPRTWWPGTWEPAPRRRCCRLKTGESFLASPRNCQPFGTPRHDAERKSCCSAV